MFIKLIKHNWKSYWRSPFLAENLFIFVLKLLLFMFILNFGFFAIKGSALFVEELFDYKNLFGVGLILYFVYDLILRYAFQSFPSMDVEPYLALPVPKNMIIGNLFLRSISSPFVMIPLILMIPLMMYLIPKFEDFQFTTNSFIFLLGVVSFNHFFIYWTSISESKTKFLSFILFWCIIVFSFLQLKGYIDILPLLIEVSTVLFSTAYLSILPLLFSLIFVYLLIRRFRSSLYIRRNEGIGERVLPIQFFSQYGEVGKQVDFEINMMLRLKALKSFLFLSLIWIAYPMLITANIDSEFSMMVFSIFGTFGAVQLCLVSFAFHTYHFDGLVSLRTPEIIIKGKYYHLCLICVILFVVASVFYSFINLAYLPYLLAGAFYNSSIVMFFSLYIAMKFMKPKNPYKSPLFKQQTDFSLEAMLISTFSVFGQLIPFYIGYFLIGSWFGVLLVVLSSVIVFILRNKIIDKLVKVFNNNRYGMYSKYKNFNE